MKTREEILEYIEKLESDDRYKAPKAVIQINAPLALMQLSIGTKIDVLKWVLSEG